MDIPEHAHVTPLSTREVVKRTMYAFKDRYPHADRLRIDSFEYNLRMVIARLEGAGIGFHDRNP